MQSAAQPRPWHLQHIIDRLTWITSEITQGLTPYLDPREFANLFISASVHKDITPIFTYLKDKNVDSEGNRLINFNDSLTKGFTASKLIIENEFWTRKRLTAAQVAAIEEDAGLIDAITFELLKVPVIITIERPPTARGQQLETSISSGLGLLAILENMDSRARAGVPELDPSSNLPITSLDQIKFDHGKQRELDAAITGVKWQEFAMSKDFTEFCHLSA